MCARIVDWVSVRRSCILRLDDSAQCTLYCDVWQPSRCCLRYRANQFVISSMVNHHSQTVQRYTIHGPQSMAKLRVRNTTPMRCFGTKVAPLVTHEAFNCRTYHHTLQFEQPTRRGRCFTCMIDTCRRLHCLHRSHCCVLKVYAKHGV
jgi:hypothetical protein